MNYLFLPDNAARQLIDSATLFAEYRRVKAQAQAYVGAMYWKKEGGYEYLVASLREALTEAERMNKALKARRTPNPARDRHQRPRLRGRLPAPPACGG